MAPDPRKIIMQAFYNLIFSHTFLYAASFPAEGMPFCPKCGASINEGALFCPSCGASLGPSAAGSPNSSGGQGPPVWGGPPPGPVMPNYSAADTTALGKLKIFALIGIAGIALGVIVPVALGAGFTSFFAFSPASSSTAIGSLVAVAEIIGIIGFSMGAVSIFLARSFFKTLSSVDSGFSTPSLLVFGLLAGLGLFVVAFIILLAFILGLFGPVFTPSGPVSSAFGLVIGASFLIIFAAIAVLIGIIGLILGLWRAGERYDETILKVGGILFIIPYVDIVAPILVLIGALNAQKKVSAATAGNQRSVA
jgi:hypothetical protein